MLVLTRKPQEKIQIGDSITVTVIKSKGQGVRLGIEAPGDVAILRGELVAARESFAGDAPSEPAAGEEIRFARVSRSRVATVLPDLLGESTDAREALEPRQAASA